MKFFSKRKIKVVDEETFITKMAIQNHFGISSYFLDLLVKQRTLSEPVNLEKKSTGWPLSEVRKINATGTR